VYAPGYNSPCLELNGHEGQPTNANSGYAFAKRTGELHATQAALEHVVIARPSNLYGPRDYYHPREQAHVIPALIDKVLNDDEIIVNGTGNERREFLFVEDAAAGLMHLMEHGAHREAYNLGTGGGTVISIRSLVDKIQVYAGTNKPVRFTSQFDAGDDARWSNCDKLSALGWQYRTGLDEGIKRTLEDYQRRQPTKKIYVQGYHCDCGLPARYTRE
jgi:GDP-L-fucose synthase